MKKMATIQALALMTLAVFAIGCGSDGGQAAEDASSLMPSSAVGLIHIDVAQTRDDIKAAAEKEESLKPFLGFIEPLEKIESADMYLIPSGREPMPMVAIRGSLGIKDIEALIEKTELKGSKLVKGENGRYTLEGQILIIIGDEADDIPEGVILGGIAPMLTPEFIESLGKEENTAVQAMIAKVDTKAHIWGGVAMPEREQKQGAPKEIYGSANITGDNPLNISMPFADEAKAAKTMEEFAGAPPFIKEVISMKQDGATVNITMIGEGNLIDNAVKMVTGMLGSMMGPPMGPEPMPGPAIPPSKME